MNRHYVLLTTITSQDTETREFTPYNDHVIALRKYHEALTGIGTGCKRLCVSLLDQYLNIIKKEVWVAPDANLENEG